MIVHPEGNWTSNPSLKSFIDLILEKNIGVILMAPGQLPVAYKDKIKHIELNRFYLSAFVKISDYIHIEAISKLYTHVWKTVKLENILTIISVDRVGLIISTMLVEKLCVKHVHWSFEITFEEEVGSVYKRLERNLLKRVDAVLIQDLIRADVFAKENEYNKKNIHVVPLSSRGPVNKCQFRVRDQLGIRPHDKVCLFMGSTAKWTMLSSVLATVNKWPDDWKLLIVSDKNINEGYPTISANPKVFIYNKRFEFVDDMANLMNGINLGIGFYDPDYNGKYTGKNLKYLGLASGKLNTYLRYNIPILMNDKNLYKEHNKTQKFAINIKGCVSEEIPNLLNHYKDLSFGNRPRAFYENYLMFEKYENVILKLVL